VSKVHIRFEPLYDLVFDRSGCRTVAAGSAGFCPGAAQLVLPSCDCDELPEYVRRQIKEAATIEELRACLRENFFATGRARASWLIRVAV